MRLTLSTLLLISINRSNDTHIAIDRLKIIDWRWDWSPFNPHRHWQLKQWMDAVCFYLWWQSVRVARHFILNVCYEKSDKSIALVISWHLRVRHPNEQFNIYRIRGECFMDERKSMIELDMRKCILWLNRRMWLGGNKWFGSCCSVKGIWFGLFGHLQPKFDQQRSEKRVNYGHVGCRWITSDFKQFQIFSTVACYSTKRAPIHHSPSMPLELFTLLLIWC